MENEFDRTEILSLLDALEAWAAQTLNYLCGELALSEECQKKLRALPGKATPNTHNPEKEAAFKSMIDWFTERFENGGDIEDLNPEDLKVYSHCAVAGAAMSILRAIPRIRDRLGEDHDFTLLAFMFWSGAQYGAMDMGLILGDPHTMHSWGSLLSKWAMEERWRNTKSEKQKAAEPAIQWMLKRWEKGEKADHAAFSDHAYDKFDIEKKGISRTEFRKLVRDAAYEHFPHKVRGIKKPPAL